MSHVRCLVICFFYGLCFSGPLTGDTLWLRDGDTLHGQINGIEKGKIKLKTSWAGEIEVDLRYVKLMETQQMMWVRMKGQDTFRLVRFTQKDNKTWLEDETGNAIELGNQQGLATLVPEKPANEEQWLYSGDIGLYLTLKRGDKIEDEFKGSGTFNIRDRVNRNIITWEGEYSRNRDITTDKELKINYDYNRFWNEHYYILGNGLWQYDESESPYSRISTGTGVGYQFWDTPDSSLKSDVGLSYLWENYKTEENNRTWAMRWGLNGSYSFTGNLSGHIDSVVYYRFGHKRSLWDMSATLRYQLTDNLWFNTLYELDYDSVPAEGSKKSNSSLKFGLGYGW